MRVLRDELRRTILVYETETPSIADHRVLMFESRRSCWRVDQYPADWRSLRNEDLLALRPGEVIRS